MKKTTNFLLVLIALSLSILSGCSSITKVDEDKVEDVSDKIIKAIANNPRKIRAERQESHTINAENLTDINIQNSVGEIHIDTHESQDALVELQIVAESDSQERCEQLAEDFTYVVEKGIKSIDIDTTYKEKYNAENISTHLKITLPQNIENITVSSNVGDIHIRNIDGKFEITNNVGEIIVENSKGIYKLTNNVGDLNVDINAANKKSTFTTNTGDISLSIRDITTADSIKATTNVGDIIVSVPKNSDYAAVINEFMQDKKTESSGNKHTKIEITTDTGEIQFN